MDEVEKELKNRGRPKKAVEAHKRYVARVPEFLADSEGSFVVVKVLFDKTGKSTGVETMVAITDQAPVVFDLIAGIGKVKNNIMKALVKEMEEDD